MRRLNELYMEDAVPADYYVRKAEARHRLINAKPKFKKGDMVIDIAHPRAKRWIESVHDDWCFLLPCPPETWDEMPDGEKMKKYKFCDHFSNAAGKKFVVPLSRIYPADGAVNDYRDDYEKNWADYNPYESRKARRGSRLNEGISVKDKASMNYLVNKYGVDGVKNAIRRI